MAVTRMPRLINALEQRPQLLLSDIATISDRPCQPHPHPAKRTFRTHGFQRAERWLEARPHYPKNISSPSSCNSRRQSQSGHQCFEPSRPPWLDLLHKAALLRDRQLAIMACAHLASRKAAFVDIAHVWPRPGAPRSPLTNNATSTAAARGLTA